MFKVLHVAFIEMIITRFIIKFDNQSVFPKIYTPTFAFVG